MDMHGHVRGLAEELYDPSLKDSFLAPQTFSIFSQLKNKDWRHDLDPKPCRASAVQNFDKKANQIRSQP